MSPSCCVSPSNEDENLVEQSNATDQFKPQHATISSSDICCVGPECGCDDACVDEFARAICADGDDLHPTKGDDSISLASEETCKCDDASVISIGATKEHIAPEVAPASASGIPRCGLHKRKTAAKKQLPKKACGEHVSIAHKRQKDTLAAFGCICKALLAKGFNSCCSNRAPASKPSIISLRKSNKSRSSVSSASFRADSCCNGQSASHASLGTCRKKKVALRTSDDSCCASGACANPRRAGFGSAQSIHESRRTSVNSDCADSCYAGPKGDVYADPEKADRVMQECAEANHVVLAVKGMTCTGCENKLMKALRAQSVITNVKTSLVLARAEFDHACDAQDLPGLLQTLQERTGFTIERIASSSTARILELKTPLVDKLLLDGMPDGVQQVNKVDQTTVRVIYNPQIIGARRVLDYYSDFSPVLAPLSEDPSLVAGAKHVHALLLRTSTSAFLTVPVLVMTWAPLPPHHRAYSIASLVLATLVQTAIAGPFYAAAFKSLFFSHVIEVDLLIVLSTTAAYVYSVVAFTFQMLGQPLDGGSFFETSTLLVTLIMLGQLASAFARQRAIAAISLRSLQEQSATILQTCADGREEESVIDARLLQYDDIFRIHPDSVIITDGVIVSGTTSVDESMMTGEAMPVSKTVGDQVIAGTVNGSGSLLVKVVRLPGENTISDIAEMVDDARLSRARVQETVDRVCAWFVPTILILAAITFGVWLAVGIRVRKQSPGDAAVKAITYAIAVLAISCPCAIGLAVPMVVLVASGVAARLGIVFKAATTIEIARKVTHVVFDKTGTLTTGQLEVVECALLQDSIEYGQMHVSTKSAVMSLASASKHPVARAIAAYLADTEKAAPEVVDIEEITSKGIQGLLGGQLLQGGNAKWLNLQDHPTVNAAHSAGYAVFCVTYSNAPVAVISLTDSLRHEAMSLVSALRARNIQVAILSGDHAVAVQRVAAALGIAPHMSRAACLPSDKAAFIRDLQSRGGKVIFCGDGTNDSVALSQADIGIQMSSETSSMGAAAAAAVASDAVLVHPSLEGILTLIQLSNAVWRRIVANFLWALVYNLVAILFASGALGRARITPAYAGLGELVSVLPVVLIAMQLRWFKKPAV